MNQHKFIPLDILDFLKDKPTDVEVNEIQQEIGYSRKTLDKWLLELHKRKYIEITRIIGRTKMWKIS